MKQLDIHTTIKIYSPDELSAEEQQLVEAAKEATTRSYAPYSHFHVGAAALLANGEIISGTNQENAAYPSGICAERTTLFYANSQHPQQAVKALAIAARTSEVHWTETPISPCGACRQVMTETENRHEKPMKILLCSAQEVFVIESAKDLLPVSFGSEDLK